MSENEIKPVVWDMSCETTVDGAEIPGTTDITPCPHGRFVHIDDYKSAIDRLTAALEASRKEAQFLRSHRPIARRLTEVTADRDAAVADAERYRWLRDKCNHIGGGLHIQFSSNASEADAAIDAARAQERQG